MLHDDGTFSGFLYRRFSFLGGVRIGQVGSFGSLETLAVNNQDAAAMLVLGGIHFFALVFHLREREMFHHEKKVRHCPDLLR